MRIIAWSSDVCSSDLSVARDRLIHVLRPGVDAAGDVENLAETLRAEVVGRLRPAPAVVAEETQRQVAGLGQQVLELAGVEPRIGHGDGRQLATLRRPPVDGGGRALGAGGGVVRWGGLPTLQLDGTH